MGIPAPGVRWAVERSGILIFLADGTTQFLSYPHAALWDLLVRDFDRRKSVSLMTVIAGCSDVEAENLVATELDSWRSLGLLSSAPNRE
jgi:hypothetical protein